MRSIIVLAVLICNLLWLAACKKEEELSRPSLTNISPAQGLAGTTVTLRGSGFSSPLQENTVEFNGVPALVTSATLTELTVTVPEGAGTGKIRVSVKGQTISSTRDFTVLLPPAITGFAPASGGADTSVTIQGTNFSSIAGENIFTFNAVAASVSAATPTQLTVVVPQGVN